MSQRCYLRLLILLVVMLALPWQPAAAGALTAPSSAPALQEPNLGPLTFSTDFDPDTNTPINPGTHFGSDTSGLHVSFEYDGMREGRTYTAVWYWKQVPFDPRSGKFESAQGVMIDSIGNADGSPLPEGQYDFDFFIGGGTWLSGWRVIEGSPEPDEPSPVDDGLPTFGDVTFSTGFDADTNTPINPGTQFSSDTVRLHVSWEYEGVRVGTPYTGVWYWEGVPFSERSGEFERTDGVMENSIDTTDGLPLPESIYTFAFMVSGETVVDDGCEVGGVPQPDEPAPVDDGLPHIDNVTFSTGFDWETLTPIDPGTRFDSDTVRLHVSWEYSGATVGTPFKGIWTPAGDWSDARGEFERTEGVMATAITTSDGQPLPEGVYGFSGVVNGEELFYDECVVGDAPEPDEPAPFDDGLPDFSPVSVTSEYDETLEEPVGSTAELDYGVTRLYFYCSFENMPDGAEGITTVYHDQEFLYQSDIVFDFPEGMWWEEVENPDGSPLAAGTYSVIFEVDGRPAGMGDGTVDSHSELLLLDGTRAPAVRATAPPEVSGDATPEHSATGPRFGEISFGLDVTDDGEIIGESDTFPAGTTSVWAYFRHFDMQEGTLWGRRWEENGELLQEKSDLAWEFGDDGWLAPRINLDPLPLQGEYKLTLTVDGRTVQEASFIVDTEQPSEVVPPTVVPAATEALPPDSWKGGSGERTNTEVEPETEAEPPPTFGPMRFTTDFDEASGRPTGSVKAFKPGIDRFYAYADWEGAVPGSTVFISGIYYNPLVDEQVLIYLNQGTLLTESGTWWEEIYDIEESTKFLLPGVYRVTVTTAAETEDVTQGRIMISPDLEAAEEVYSGQLLPTTEPVSPGPEPTQASAQPVATVGIPGLEFGPIRFTTEFDARNMKPVGSVSLIESGNPHFFAYAEIGTVPPGTVFDTRVHYVDPEQGNMGEVYNNTDDQVEGGGVWWEQIKDIEAGELRTGKYVVTVFVDDQIVGEGEIAIGSEAAATPVPPELEETPIVTSPSLIEGGLEVGPVLFSDTYDEDTDDFGPAATTFPAGTTSVTALFTYQNMADGMSWGQIWMNDGDVHDEDTNAVWDEGPEGWTGYYVEEDDGFPLNGEFELKLFIEGVEVQNSSFTVDAPAPCESEGSTFGAIQFAEGIVGDGVPYEISSEIEEGIERVYGVFSYDGMSDGQDWAWQWLRNGEEIHLKDDAWDETYSGVTSVYLRNPADLAPGTYTLNLYIDGELARSGDFEITGSD